MANGEILTVSYRGLQRIKVLDGQSADSDGTWIDSLNDTTRVLEIDGLEAGGTITLYLSNDTNPTATGGVSKQTFSADGFHAITAPIGYKTRFAKTAGGTPEETTAIYFSQNR